MVPNRIQVTVLIAYDVAMTCELYAQALKRFPGFRVAGYATTIEGVLNAAQHDPADVALIGVTLADGPQSGLAVLKELRQLQPALKPVMLLDRSDISLVIAAFRAGARGVFDPSRPDAFRRLRRCVERVNDGQIWATGAELVQVLHTLSQPSPLQVVNSQGIELLTRREQDVARLVAEGLTNREIGSELNISEYTVRNNLFRIFDKLGVSTRVELTLRVVKNSHWTCPHF